MEIARPSDIRAHTSNLALALRRRAGEVCELGGGDHARALDDLAESIGDPSFRLLVFGEFSAGKSTLINALLGRRVLPAKARPTTGHATHLVAGERDGVTARFADGREE